MPAALIVTLFVATGLSGEPMVAAMRGALVEALGAETRVEQRSVEEPGPRADDLVRDGGRGVVAWIDIDDERLVAVLHVHREGADWQSRTLRFAKGDAVEERGRTLGFVLAAMVRPEAAQPVVNEAATPQAQPGPLWAADLLAAGGAGLGGSAGGLGGSVGLRRVLVPGLGARLGAGVLTRQLDGAIRLWSARASLGVSVWRALGRSFVLGARADAMVLWESAARDDGDSSRQGRVLPGGAAWLEAAWPVSPRFQIVADAGLEAAIGRTSIYLDDRRVATVPPLRLSAEVGVRAAF